MSLPILLSLRSISKSVIEPNSQTKVDILKAINLDIYAGESLAICAASGEGKSTLLHIMGLLEKPSSGSILFPCWPQIHADTLRSSYMGFIFQSFHLLEDLSVEDNIMLPARIAQKGLRVDPSLKMRAQELMQLVGLSARASFSACKLSGGEKQRCAIARALFMQPRILFADEPTGNLDHDTAQSISDLLLKLCSEHTISLVLVTHSQSLAKRCKSQVQLQRGELFYTSKGSN